MTKAPLAAIRPAPAVAFWDEDTLERGLGLALDALVLLEDEATAGVEEEEDLLEVAFLLADDALAEADAAAVPDALVSDDDVTAEVAEVTEVTESDFAAEVVEAVMGGTVVDLTELVAAVDAAAEVVVAVVLAADELAAAASSPVTRVTAVPAGAAADWALVLAAMMSTLSV